MAFLRRISCTLVAATVAASLTGCGSSKSSAVSTASDSRPSILTAPVQSVTFAAVERTVQDLYRTHPGIGRFSVQDVEYTTATRDKVLKVCREGGPEKSAAALESARVLACAPLIFFFYSYGRMRSVPASIAVAQKLYWYAVASNERPHAAQPGVTSLLRKWGVR